MKSKLNTVYIQVRDTNKIIETNIVPDGYNIYQGAIITHDGSQYIVLDRTSFSKGFLLTVIKK